MNNKARITYRFDKEIPSIQSRSAQNKNIIPLREEEVTILSDWQGTEPSGLEKHRGTDAIYDSQELNPYKTDFGAWSSPFDMETEKLEKIIRESDRQMDPPERHLHDDDEELLRHDPLTGFYERKQGAYEFERSSRPEAAWRTSGFVRRSSMSWLKIAASVTGAVITGLVFGYFILNMFTGEQQIADTVTADPQQNIAAPLIPEEESGAMDNTAEENSKKSVAGTEAAVNIPAANLFILQIGVFSSADGAEAAVNELRKKGFAAATESRDKHYVYAGVTVDRNGALLLSHVLKEEQVEIFVKSYETPAVTVVKWNGEQTEAVETFIKRGRSLLRMISDLTLLRLQDAVPFSFDDSTMQSLKKEHQAWTVESGTLRGNVPVEETEGLQQMLTAMQTAIVSMEEYNKNPSHAHLWQAQTSAMRYMIAEKNWLQRLAIE